MRRRRSGCPGRRLRWTYLCALTSIALLTLVAQAVVQVALAGAADDAIEINFAGRQRMLSQRIAKSALLLDRSNGQSDEFRRALSDDLATWASAHHELHRGSERFPGHDHDGAVAEGFGELDPVVARVVDRAGLLVRTTVDASERSRRTDELVSDLNLFVQGMDEIVFELDRISTARVHDLKWLEIALAIATVLVLVIEATLVFEPAVRTLGAQFAESDRLRAEAEQATKAKSTFLASMSHEIRTPMTAILGFGEVLLDDSMPEAEKEHATRTIDRNARHLLQLVNDLLDLSKAESGSMQLERVAVDLRELIHDAIRICETKARDQDTMLRFVIDGEVPERILTDPLRTRQCVINLVSNAVKFTPDGTVTVRLSADRAKRSVSVAVEDTGCGIPENRLEQIFGAYQQAEASTARRQGGTGLGLAITRTIVEALGGTIQVTSEVGRGSEFRFELPIVGITTQWVSSPIESPVRPVEVIERVPMSGRVLLVDDTPDNRHLYSVILEREGLEVVACSNGEEGRDAALREGAYELILTDFDMPGMNGLELTALLRSEGVETPVLLLTADASASMPEQAREAGCDGVLAKPVRRSVLLREVRESLMRSRSQQLASPDPTGDPTHST